MKRKLSYFGAVVLVAACAFAEPKTVELSCATGTNTTASATNKTISGYIDEIVLDAPSGVTSGVVSIVATQPMGNTVTLATKTVTADTLIRLRVDGTENTGSALTSDPPGRYLCYGDSIVYTVSAADPTGLTWKAWIKYDTGK